jgi:hypothetical protein
MQHMLHFSIAESALLFAPGTILQYVFCGGLDGILSPAAHQIGLTVKRTANGMSFVLNSGQVPSTDSRYRITVNAVVVSFRFEDPKRLEVLIHWAGTIDETRCSAGPRP